MIILDMTTSVMEKITDDFMNFLVF
jgi:hypothetical protein